MVSGRYIACKLNTSGQRQTWGKEEDGEIVEGGIMKIVGYYARRDCSPLRTSPFHL
ncbi:hypothetical protein DPMN_150665 [Dreissena polymorpha]|uniref:Uncharacterized protein n=1 Tax=Dreissena polymorpha TaxID=45954 RepID=A0A9D4J3J5_DREPO|nr:hypothetical protein DPMN_150665 [Dreissena polymorpha]